MIRTITKFIRGFPKARYYGCSNEKFVITKEEIEAIKQLIDKSTNPADLANNMNVSMDKVFKEREQQISFKLMNCSEIDQIFKLYYDESLKQQQDKNELPFNANELALFAYFTGCLGVDDYGVRMKNHQNTFNSIVDQCLMKVNELEPQQFCALMWAMSTFKIEMGNLIYNEAKEYIIREKAKMVIQNLEPDSLTSLAFALNNVLKQSSDLILEISKLVSKNKNQITPSNLVTFIGCLPTNALTNSKSIFEHLVDQFDQELLTHDQFLQTILDLIRISNYQKSPFILQLLDKFTQSLDGQIKQKLQITMMKAIDLLIILTQLKGNEFTPHAKQLLKIVYSKGETLNITEYLSLFLALPKIRVNISKEISIEKTLNVLIQLLEKSQVFAFTDFEPSEKIQIITACAALRLDNHKLIKKLIDSIEIRYLSKQDLLILAQCFVIYVRQFEVEYLDIHATCCKRRLEFDELERAQLLLAFSRIKILIPDSPFFQ